MALSVPVIAKRGPNTKLGDYSFGMLFLGVKGVEEKEEEEEVEVEEGVNATILMPLMVFLGYCICYSIL